MVVLVTAVIEQDTGGNKCQLHRGYRVFHYTEDTGCFTIQIQKIGYTHDNAADHGLSATSATSLPTGEYSFKRREKIDK